MIGTQRYHGGLLDSGCWHLHPLNYVLGLATAATAAGVRIYEQSRAHSYTHTEPAVVGTEHGEVRAKFVVLAGDTYLGRMEPRIAAHTMPINNFMLATEPLSGTAAKSLIPQDVAVADTKFVINYWRLSADRRLLFGGGETYSAKFPDDIRGFVRKYMLKIYPQLKDVRIDYGWGGTIGITLRRLPHFGRLAPNVFFAHGWSGQGIALATLGGRLLAEVISGTAERFDVYARLPVRRFPGGRLLRHPALVLGMLYFSLRDKL
jgi:gamma-glutamylputrescine oxidase